MVKLKMKLKIAGEIMINFIICMGTEIIVNKCSREIDKFMMQYDTDYKCHVYREYNREWEEYASTDDGFKIYILNSNDGDDNQSNITAARKIREDFDDWVSMIILTSEKYNYKSTEIEKRLMLASFVNNMVNFETQLKIALTRCMKNYDNRIKTLKYFYKNNIYNIELKQILTIKKEPDNKRCIINTLTKTYQMPENLNKILESLDDRFIMCHRNMIINLEQVKNYNSKLGIITFKNGQTINNISRSKKKNIINYFRGLK